MGKALVEMAPSRLVKTSRKGLVEVVETAHPRLVKSAEAAPILTD
jgi:hypothetical protein